MGNFSRCLRPVDPATMAATDWEENTPLAPTERHEIRFSSVMSASV